MAGKIKSDIIQGESSLKLNVGETTIITVDASNYNIAQPLNVQSTMTVVGAATFQAEPNFAGGLGTVTIDTANITDATVSGNLTVSGETTYVNTSTLTVQDKNIELANTPSPTDSLADGAGLTILGSTNKTFTWSNTTKAFTFNQGIDIQQVIETANVDATALNANTNFDVLEGAVKYYSANNAANWTLNVRGDSSTTLNSVMNTGDSVTIAYLATQLSANTFYQSAMQVDGNSVTPKWQGGSAPSAGNATSIDVYSFTILKTAANTYTVLGSQTQYA
jgi:hypothetical protein